MTSKLGGRPTKDSPISDAFNQIKVGAVLTKRDIAAAKRAARTEKLRHDEELRKKMVPIDLMREKLDRAVSSLIKDENLPKTPPADPPDKPDKSDASSATIDDDDAQSAYQMLKHLRYAYRNSVGPDGKKGRGRLTTLMDDDKEFKFMVKELLKIEASLMAAKIRKEGDTESPGSRQQNFFVVLKGLEEEKKLLSDAGVVDKTVDMKQIQRAINPDLGEVYEAEEESKSVPPEQLSKVNSDNVEDW